jgi:hypothetical protein
MAPFPAPGGVLALDLGSTTGWAYGHVDQKTPAFGHWHCKLEGDWEGERYMRLSNQVWQAFEDLKPSKVVLEAALKAGAMHNDYAMNQQVGMRASVLEQMARHNLSRPFFFSTNLIRAEMLGRSWFPKGKAKEAVKAWARREGYLVANDHQADAICLWRYWVDAQRHGGEFNRLLLWDYADVRA